MSNFIINDHILNNECNALAQEIFDEMLKDLAEDETPDHYRDEMSDRAHEDADGHQWVIYCFKAHMLCAHCNVDQGEEFLGDVGMHETPTYDSFGTAIAYGEMRARIESHIQDLCDEWEEAQE